MSRDLTEEESKKQLEAYKKRGKHLYKKIKKTKKPKRKRGLKKGEWKGK